MVRAIAPRWWLGVNSKKTLVLPFRACQKLERGSETYRLRTAPLDKGLTSPS